MAAAIATLSAYITPEIKAKAQNKAKKIVQSKSVRSDDENQD
jgi:hypothetical protein